MTFGVSNSATTLSTRTSLSLPLEVEFLEALQAPKMIKKTKKYNTDELPLTMF